MYFPCSSLVVVPFEMPTEAGLLWSAYAEHELAPCCNVSLTLISSGDTALASPGVGSYTPGVGFACDVDGAPGVTSAGTAYSVSLCEGPAAFAFHCDDNDPCTVDSCDGATGCTYEPIAGCCEGNRGELTCSPCVIITGSLVAGEVRAALSSGMVFNCNLPVFTQ
jgi:slime mold repeat-containing protein